MHRFAIKRISCAFEYKPAVSAYLHKKIRRLADPAGADWAFGPGRCRCATGRSVAVALEKTLQEGEEETPVVTEGKHMRTARVGARREVPEDI
jgi:hypothetical protein